jgi:citrate synthase
MSQQAKAGLEDVIAGRSAICTVDGAAGRLHYRGYEIGELAGAVSFEDVVHLLWEGELPTPEESRAIRTALRDARGLPGPVLDLLHRLPPSTHPLDALRTAVSLLASFDPDTGASDEPANRRKCLRLVAAVPEIAAAWQRIRNGHDAVAPPRDPLDHAAHFLHALRGAVPGADETRVMDVLLVLHAEHELNASTFAARVAVATVADVHAAVVAAIATLKGPRHGGANEDVLRMLLEIGDPDRAEAFVQERLGARAGLSRTGRSDPRNRIPGFGHRVYRVDDARARVLRGMARSMAEATGQQHLFALAERVYGAMKAGTGLPVNVDFFSAVVYAALGLPEDFCTSVFATGRVAGWSAHILEQYADNRLIRPRAEYVGPAPRALAGGRAAPLGRAAAPAL